METVWGLLLLLLALWSCRCMWRMWQTERAQERTIDAEVSEFRHRLDRWQP